MKYGIFARKIAQCAVIAAITMCPAAAFAQGKCDGFLVPSGDSSKISEGTYVQTLPVKTTAGSCSRFNRESVALRFSKVGKRLSATIEEEKLSLRGREPVCGGTGISRTLSGAGKRSKIVDVLAHIDETSGNTKFTVLYVERRGKVSCFRTFGEK